MSQYTQDQDMGGFGQEQFDDSIFEEQFPAMNIVHTSKKTVPYQGRVITQDQNRQYYPNYNYTQRRDQEAKRKYYRPKERQTHQEKQQRYALNRENLRRSMQSPRQNSSQKGWMEKPIRYRQKIQQTVQQQTIKAPNIQPVSLEQPRESQVKNIESEDLKSMMTIRNEIEEVIVLPQPRKDIKIVEVGMAPIIEAMNESSVLFEAVQESQGNKINPSTDLIQQPIIATEEDLLELEIVDIQVSLKSKTLAQNRSPKKLTRVSRSHRSIDKIVSPNKFTQLSMKQSTNELQQILNRINAEQMFKFYPIEIEFKCGNNTKEVKVRTVRLNVLNIDVAIDFDSNKKPITKSIIPSNQLEKYIRFLDISHSYQREYRSGYLHSQSQLCLIRISPENLDSGFHFNLIQVSTIEMRCFCDTRNQVPISSSLSAQLSCRSCSKPMQVSIFRLQIIAQ